MIILCRLKNWAPSSSKVDKTSLAFYDYRLQLQIVDLFHSQFSATNKSLLSLRIEIFSFLLFHLILYTSSTKCTNNSVFAFLLFFSTDFLDLVIWSFLKIWIIGIKKSLFLIKTETYGPWKHFCPNWLCYLTFFLCFPWVIISSPTSSRLFHWLIFKPERFFWWKLWIENCRGWIKMSQIYVPPESRKTLSFKFAFLLLLWESSADGIGEAFLKYLWTAFFQWKWPRKTRTAGNEKELTSQKRNENSNLII